jgi:transcriptional regulator with XRE-family HTH domain
MLTFSLMAPADVARAVAERARARRLALGLTQEQVAERVGIGLSSLRRFEGTGRIAFDALVRLAFVLEAVEELGGLFPEPAFASLDEVVARPKRRRGLRRRRAPE